VSQYRMGEAVNAYELVKHVTVVGRLTPVTDEDSMKLTRLAYDFRRAVLYATRMIVGSMDVNAILSELRGMLNKAYGDSAYKVAKAVVEGCKFNGGDPGHIKIRRLFIVSEGEAFMFGNRNIRLESTNTVKIRYPYNSSWITCGAQFGKAYLPLIKELVELTKNREESYGARIVFRNGRIYLHLSIPIELYLKHFKKGEAKGSLVVGFDLNSDRINMVIIDRYGRIRDAKTEWFPEVTSQGYPKIRAKARRLDTLAKLLKYAYHHGVGVVVFENLMTIKKRKYTKNRVANRKITRFAKKELLQYGIVTAMKHGFKVLLVNPKGTTKSEEHDKVMKRYGLDRHTASAYLIALRGIERHSLIQKATD